LRSLDQILNIQGRTRILLLLITAVMILCMASYWFFQVVRRPYFEELAERNQYREGRIAAPRGKILDRRGLGAYNEESIRKPARASTRRLSRSAARSTFPPRSSARFVKDAGASSSSGRSW
jgi:cell division protein FtsI/penicillin-binding protein 2